MKNNLSTEAVIRAAKGDEWARADEHGDEGSLVSVGDTSLRHTDVDTGGGGASRLSKSAVGTAALQAALTLHPCVHISGCGEATVEVLSAIFSQVGECRIMRDLDDEGVPTGDASATYANAAAAAAAIERFDGERFDDGALQVSVSKRAAQGSLTTRGRGRGRGKEGLTFHDRQQDLISQQIAERARGEREAFAVARAAALAAGPSGPMAGPAAPPRRPLGEEPFSKKAKVDARAVPPKLPGFLAMQKIAAAPAVAMPAATAPVSHATPVAHGGSGLLGLVGYGSDEDDEDDE